MLLDEPPIWTKWQTIDLEERSGNYFSPTSTFVRYCTTILTQQFTLVCVPNQENKDPGPCATIPPSSYQVEFPDMCLVYLNDTKYSPLHFNQILNQEAEISSNENYNFLHKLVLAKPPSMALVLVY